MLKLMLSLSMTMNFLILFSFHPLFMTLIIIMQTLMLCLILNFFSLSMWFSYILFLTFLGGMLILFIYMTSLSSNNKLSLNIYKLTSFILFSLLINFFFLYKMDMNYSMIFFQDSFNLQNFLIMYEYPKNLNMMYNNPNFMITIMMISYLLITLIIIINISNPKIGALRHLY
uniref:NADH-ubiquinone oxidoreductase chain 6 n=1 Tax=Natula pravdini TaxID=2652438 RepID=A0A856T919_9ORTH|nr:NADH dehydrogenase subunit 6 [Natula pravdini]QFG38980.1 NADH dehydrogenase subunit 6 [Natula pravdini]